MYPKIIINIPKLKHNVDVLSKLLKDNNIDIAMVTKSYCSMSEVIEQISENVDYLADSRVENLKNLSHINIPKILLRIPMISEVKKVIKYSDISFNSEISTIYELNKEAKNNNRIHKIVLMFDLGDLREGYFEEEELFNVVETVLDLANIELFGIATNLTCYGAIIPSTENLGRLVNIAKNIESKYNIKLKFVSGGNSSSIDLLIKGKIPKGITNLRLGEAILFGQEAAYGNDIDNTYQDVFKLLCEVVEVKDKPSMPIGEIGMDAFRNIPHYEDRGILKRAIVAIGKQDIKIDCINPVDKNIEILGASSDHMILNITDCNDEYNVGDIIEFNIGYGALLSGCTSKYVYKEIMNDKGIK